MRVSVVVPVWNGELYLRAALESIFAQTLRPFEVIVADDGSTDSTKQIASTFPTKVVSQENSGTAAARNLGIGAATGDVIAMLDHDDLWLPDKLRMQVKALENDRALDIVFTAVEQFVSEDTPEAIAYAPADLTPMIGPCASTLCARQSAFERFGLFPPHHGDWLAWLTNAQDKGAGTYVVPECLARRRIHNSNLSRVKSSEVRSDFLWYLRKRLAAQGLDSG
jgi:glycosyltransferase involved in cell wall biosynthesis